MNRILVVEDHADLAFGLQTALENEGFGVEVAADGSSGLDRAWTGGFDLIILDLMLPKLDGYRVLRALRTDGSEGADPGAHRAGRRGQQGPGVHPGADDYVTKPFGTLELIARVHALLRRARRGEGPPLPAVERFGEIEVNPASRTVYNQVTWCR
jgi:DNA-binding response OmpR family regulator